MTVFGPLWPAIAHPLRSICPHMLHREEEIMPISILRAGSARAWSATWSRTKSSRGPRSRLPPSEPEPGTPIGEPPFPQPGEPITGPRVRPACQAQPIHVAEGSPRRPPQFIRPRPRRTPRARPGCAERGVPWRDARAASVSTSGARRSVADVWLGGVYTWFTLSGLHGKHAPIEAYRYLSNSASALGCAVVGSR